MKLLDEAKYLRKDAIYEDYYKIIKNFKDYDKITTKKMLETIIDLYNQKDYLKDFLTIEEIDLLKIIIKNKHLKEEKVREHIAYESLSAKLIIRYDHTQKKYDIPEEFKASVEHTIKKLKKTDLAIIKDNTNFEKVFLGIIKIFGVLIKKDLYNLVYDYTEIDADEFDYLINLPLINYHFIILKDNVYTCADYYLYLEEAIELISKTRKLSIYERPIEDVVGYGYHDFLLTEDSTIAFLDKLDELHLYPDYILKRIKEYCNLNLDRIELKEHLADLVHNEKDYQELCILLDNMMNNTTSIAYQGRTPNEYLLPLAGSTLEDINEKIDSIKGVNNLNTRRFLACYLLSLASDTIITKRTLN